MGSTGLYIAGGLLAGAGKAITDNANRAREDALIALKRVYQVEDRDALIAGNLSVAETEAAGRKGNIIETGKQNRETEGTKGTQDRLTKAAEAVETRKTKAVEFNNDVKLAKLNGVLAIQKDTASQKLAAEIDSGQVQSVETGDDGAMIVVYKDGHQEVPGLKLHFKQDDSDDGMSITGVQAGRAGGTPAEPAKKAPSNADIAMRNRAMNTLGSVYTEIAANPQKKAQYQRQYPGMFDAAGNLLPKDELIARVNQRYGG